MPLRKLLPPVVLMALLCGTADLLFVRMYWARAGMTFETLGQSIASGWFGAASSEMGWRSASIGIGSHYFIMACMALAWFLAARAMPALRAHAWRYGALYGALLYVLMTAVVVPLSASPARPPRPDWMLASIAVHVFIVGIPIALAARRLFSQSAFMRAE